MPETQPVLTPICEYKAEKIPLASVFCDLYPPSVDRLIFFGLNLDGCKPKEGMFLIAIKGEKPVDSDFPWSIGWVTEEEIAGLFEELPVMWNL